MEAGRSAQTLSCNSRSQLLSDLRLAAMDGQRKQQSHMAGKRTERNYTKKKNICWILELEEKTSVERDTNRARERHLVDE